jgi:hypothetical protein
MPFNSKERERLACPRQQLLIFPSPVHSNYSQGLMTFLDKPLKILTTDPTGRSRSRTGSKATAKVSLEVARRQKKRTDARAATTVTESKSVGRARHGSQSQNRCRRIHRPRRQRWARRRCSNGLDEFTAVRWYGIYDVRTVAFPGRPYGSWW